MGYGLKLLLFFCFISFVYAVGIFLFTRGFLLKRIVIDERSKCSEVPPVSAGLVGLSDKSEGCWMKGTYKKAVILMIDALRYDFALYDRNLAENETLPYQNKLKVIHEVLENSPRQAALFRFVADPPTTTMQRLKGLTTGSLPTFVDAGSNFASTKITEDNIISQLNYLQKNITFMGDDTWMGLFPESFHKSLPFPSFNVKDLHTVDNGVIRHLVPELNSTDWDVLIGHFLGVDHCGHKYGPYHPAMANKLIQMDGVIRSVIEVLDEDTILFVMGDHGMTRTGDHGGDSDDEVDAALFVYSAKPLTTCHPKKDTTTTTSVSQIDLVPTFSLLLGMPIPFGNLGSIIPDLLCQGLTADPRDTRSDVVEALVGKIHRNAAFELNAAQVHRYLTKYSSLTAEISQAKLANLVKILDNATARSTEIQNLIDSFGGHGAFFEQATASELSHLDETLSAAEMMYGEFLFQAKSLCQALWAKFDLVSSFTGILLLFLNIVAVLLFLCDMPCLVTKISTMVKYSLMATIAGSVVAFILAPRDIDMPFWSAVSLASGLLLGVIVLTRTSVFQKIAHKPASWYSLFKPSADSVLTLVFCFLQGAAMFSNSFVVNEDTQIAFFVQSLFTIKCVQALWRSRELERKKLLMRSAQASKKVKKERRSDAIITVFFRIVLVWAAFVIVNRTALLFRACREEQWTCKPSDFLKPLSVHSEEHSIANNRFILTVMCLGLIPLGARQWLAYQGNLNGSSSGVLCVKFALPLAFVLVCVHWALQIAPQAMNEEFAELLRWQQVLLPRMVYCLCFLTVACLAYSPICVYTVFRDRKRSLTETIQTLQRAEGNSKIIHVLFKELKQKWQENIEEQSAFENGSANDENTPMVYGLATAYSSTLLILFLAVVLPLAMILGDGVALAVFLMCVQTLLLLEIHGLCHDLESSRSDDRISDWSCDTVALWVLLASHYFYCTGHQATIPSIRFDAAFVGFPGDMENLVLPGLLIILNTFSGPVLSAVSLPLLLFWHRIPNRLFGTGNKGCRQSEKGEFDWIENPEQLRNHLLRLVLMCQLLHGSKLLAACCSAILHRRHLMVWKIFAPRFVFEGASFLLTTVVLVIVFLAVLRVDMALRKWFRNLEMSTESRAKKK